MCSQVKKTRKNEQGGCQERKPKSILSGSESILGGSKLSLGCVLPPKNVGCPREKNTFLNERLAGVRVATPQMGSKIGPKHLVFWSFTGKHGGATPPPNKQETRKPRNKLPQESRKTCKNMVFLYTALQTGGSRQTETKVGQGLWHQAPPREVCT